MGGNDRRSYDTGASSQAQGNISSVANALEALINERDGQVKKAMSDFQADGVSDQYAGKESQWNSAAAEVRAIIALVRSALEKNDETAGTTLSKAKQAVDSIA